MLGSHTSPHEMPKLEVMPSDSVLHQSCVNLMCVSRTLCSHHITNAVIITAGSDTCAQHHSTGFSAHAANLHLNTDPFTSLCQTPAFCAKAR